MSYILDALRKADAQRVRDPARGIHAQATAATLGTGSGRPRNGPWLWVAVAAAVVAAAAWLWSSGDSNTAAPPAAVAPPPAAAVAPRIEAERVAPPAAAVLPAAPPAAAVLPPAPPVLAATRPVTAAPAAAPVRQPAAAPLPAPPVAAAPPDRMYSMAELPADVQQALPKFSVSGGVYSDNVAQRMLIVNGQVFNEGSEIAPGVVLEQIRARVALLKFRGLRITQPY